MNPSSISLHIGVGPGPREARRFVGMLADALGDRLPARGVAIHGVRRDGDRHAPGRVVLQLDAGAADQVSELLGVHRLDAALDGPRSRRRWFAAVELHRADASPSSALTRHELDIRFVRSRGPGGQNVNKRATAVQIVHRPTGLSVACDTHRSQARNRAAALETLQKMVIEHTTLRDRSQRRSAAWHARRGITRQRPVMCWRLDPRQRDCIVPITE